jgi:hypothetical protein
MNKKKKTKKSIKLRKLEKKNQTVKKKTIKPIRILKKLTGLFSVLQA